MNLGQTNIDSPRDTVIEEAAKGTCANSSGASKVWPRSKFNLDGQTHHAAVNDELARLGYTARLAKGGGYFYFHSGEVAEWLDRTVNVETISSHTLEQWVDEFKRLKNLNEQIMANPARKRSGAKRRPN